MRIAARTLLKARGFTAVVILTLTIGIALATSIIAIVNSYVLRSLPYPAANRLYNIRYAEAGQSQPRGLANLDWQSLSDVIEHPLSWDLDVFYLSGGDHPESAPGAWVTPGFMQGTGVETEIGRVFNEGEFRTGSPQVALISHPLWRDRFGSDPAILGKQFQAYVSDRPDEAETFTIIGVLPAKFWHVNPYTQVFAPLRAPNYPYMVRLRAGVPTSEAERRIGSLVRDGIPGVPAAWQPRLVSVHEDYVRNVRPILSVVTAAGGIVLLIACANVAFLILIRANRQQKDIAIRFALGAGQGRVARMLITESLLLCVTSLVLGTALAAMILNGLAPVIQQQLGRPVPGGVAALSVDPGVVAMAGVLMAFIACALTLAPLLASRRQSLVTSMRRGKQSGAEGVGGRRARSALIVLEVAGSLALLVGCGLMIRTLVHELDSDLGLNPDQVIAGAIALRERSYPDEASRLSFYDRLLDALNRTPGIESAAMANWPILSVQPPRRLEGANSSIIGVSPAYFKTLAVELKEGRVIEQSDRVGSELVAVVSETLARRLWPAGAVGQSVRLLTDDESAVQRRVVGVVEDVRQSPTDADLADLYVPLLQAPGRFSSVYVRTTISAAAWLPMMRSVLKIIDPEVTVSGVRDVNVIVGEHFARPRFLASMLLAFAAFALMLALIGIYGVIAYSVKQREHEIAVRMAVGASSAAVTRLFMREGTIVILAGVAVGAFGASLIGRMLETQLFGVRALDPATTIAMALFIAIVGCLAMWWPARRAAATDPIIALREE